VLAVEESIVESYFVPSQKVLPNECVEVKKKRPIPRITSTRIPKERREKRNKSVCKKKKSNQGKPTQQNGAREQAKMYVSSKTTSPSNANTPQIYPPCQPCPRNNQPHTHYYALIGSPLIQHRHRAPMVCKTARCEGVSGWCCIYG
jgi:hypothetical protein